MAYKIVNKFTKDDNNAWPWSRQDLPWIEQALELFTRVRQLANNGVLFTKQQTIDWLNSISVSNQQVVIEHEFATQSQANQYVLAVYEIVIDYSADFESWGQDCGYVNLQHELDTQEI